MNSLLAPGVLGPTLLIVGAIIAGAFFLMRRWSGLPDSRKDVTKGKVYIGGNVVSIVVRKRADDWHASLDGDPTVWAAGNSPYSAVGNLVTTHPENFRLRVEVEQPKTTATKPKIRPFLGL